MHLNRSFFSIVFFAFFCLTGLRSYSTERNNTEPNPPSVNSQTSLENSRFDPVNTIMEHIADSHEFHLWGEGGGSVSIPLPVILKTKINFVFFLSTAFHHDNAGLHVVERNGERFTRYKNKIYYADIVPNSTGAYLTMNGSQPENQTPIDFSITKNVFSMFISAILILMIFTRIASFYKKNEGKAPQGLQSLLEPVILFIRDEIAIPNIGGSKYHRFMPYLLTVFFFIWLNNLLGLIPFFPGSANVTGNIAVTLVLGTFTFLLTIWNGNKYYWKHIFAPHVPLWLYPIMWAVEIIGVFSKPFALIVRLFANITAGHIIVLSLISLIFIFKTLAIAPVSIIFVLFMYILELLVGFLQAFIFTMLSALFIGMAVEEHHATDK